MEICSFNINAFNGMKEKEKYEIQVCNLKKIQKYIELFLFKKDNLFILQEVPFEKKEESNAYPLFRQFLDYFSEDTYKIIMPKHPHKAKKCSLAIAKKESCWREKTQDCFLFDDNENYGNKIVELENGEISVFGLHMPWSKRSCNNDKCEEAFWDLLVSESQKRKAKKYIFIGDFNASLESQSKYYLKLIAISNSGYSDLVKKGTITCFRPKGTLDHAFVSRSLKNEIKNIEIVNPKLSDHAAIILTIG